jgi:replicative DNA helicase
MHHHPDSNQLGFVTNEDLGPEDFLTPKHQIIYESMLDARNDQGRDYFENVFHLCSSSNLDIPLHYFDELIERGSTVRGPSLIWHARALKLLSFDRQEIQLVANIYADLQQGIDASEMLDELHKLREERDEYKKGEPEAFGNGIRDWWQKLNTKADDGYVEESSIPCPLPSISRETQGFRRCEVSVLAGSPGSGKSALAMNFLLHVIRNTTLKTALISLEMNLDEINARLVNQMVDVPLKYLIDPTLLQEKKLNKDPSVDQQKLWDELMKATQISLKMAEQDVFQAVSLDSFNPNVVKSAVERSALAGADLIILDHVHRVQFSESKSFAENMTRLMVSFTEIAKATNTHIMVLSQVNRESPREGRRARMHDLKGSGGIEENASLIMMLHRDIEETPNEAELHLAKARSGQAGQTINLVFTGNRLTFGELANEYRYQE